MRIKTILGASILAVMFMGTSGWAKPAASMLTAPSQQQPSESKTVNGKVTTVTDNFVTLETKVGDGDPKTVEFSTTGDTKVEGKLAVGVTATVEYHTEDSGKNMATRIVVSAVQKL